MVSAVAAIAGCTVKDLPYTPEIDTLPKHKGSKQLGGRGPKGTTPPHRTPNRAQAEHPEGTMRIRRLCLDTEEDRTEPDPDPAMDWEAGPDKHAQLRTLLHRRGLHPIPGREGNDYTLWTALIESGHEYFHKRTPKEAERMVLLSIPDMREEELRCPIQGFPQQEWTVSLCVSRITKRALILHTQCREAPVEVTWGGVPYALEMHFALTNEHGAGPLDHFAYLLWTAAPVLALGAKPGTFLKYSQGPIRLQADHCVFKHHHPMPPEWEWHGGPRGLFHCLAASADQEEDGQPLQAEEVCRAIVQMMHEDADGTDTMMVRHLAMAALMTTAQYEEQLENADFFDRAMLLYSSRVTNARLEIHLPGESQPHVFDWNELGEPDKTTRILWKNRDDSRALDMWALALDEDLATQIEEEEACEAVSAPREDKWTWDEVRAPTPAALISQLVTQRPADTEIWGGIHLTTLDHNTHAEMQEHDLRYRTYDDGLKSLCPTIVPSAYVIDKCLGLMAAAHKARYGKHPPTNGEVWVYSPEECHDTE
eukprot:1839711-Rhodomonas_salina.3